MITLRKSDQRGLGRESWLESRHTFSFHNYQDPQHMGFRDLRVINEDRVAAGGGFPMHEHRDMEIFSFVVSGALEHRDDLDNRATIGPGELQMFSAGTGIRHSEYNPSRDEEVHFLQIWIFPQRKGLTPAYDKRSFDLDAANRLQLMVSPGGRGGAARIHQDASVYYGLLEPGRSLEHLLEEERHAWLQLIDGQLDLNGTILNPGDGAAVSNETQLRLAASDRARFLLFDLN